MRWIIDVPRSLIAGLIGVIATVVAATAIIIIALFNDDSPMIERIINGWSRTWLIFSNTKLVIEGQEHINEDQSYVVVANHQSSFDIMACFLAVPVPIRYLAKKELFQVPVLAQGMRAVGIVEVDRQARGAIHAQVNRESKKLIKKGRSLIIYAEGTRPRNGVMTRFKKGAFTMAITSQLPVLPLSIHGSYDAWPPGNLWMHGGTIRVIIDPPIETEGMTQADTGELRDQVQDLVTERVGGMGGKVAE
jgi:1-acyl-sn-glycerol-3-phosphate acyltransferase